MSRPPESPPSTPRQVSRGRLAETLMNVPFIETDYLNLAHLLFKAMNESNEHILW